MEAPKKKKQDSVHGNMGRANKPMESLPGSTENTQKGTPKALSDTERVAKAHRAKTVCIMHAKLCSICQTYIANDISSFGSDCLAITVIFFSTKRPKRLIWISVVSTFLSMQYGYNIWIVYSPTVLLQDFYNISSYEEMADPESQMFMMAVTISLFPLGGIFGALVFGCFVDRFGRKVTLVITNILSIISAMFMGLSNKVEPIEFTMFARLYTGICTGLISTVIPLYLCEISQTNMRGSITMLHHLFLTLGVLVARILALRELLGTPEGWPVLMSLAGLLPLIQVALLPLFPESPRYLLIQKKKEEGAAEVLRELRETEDVEEEIEELRQESTFEKGEKKMNMLKLLLRSHNQRWQVISIFVLMLGQQLTGTNAAYYYTEKIYLRTQMGIDKVRFISIASDASLSFSTSLGIYLVDSVGRRTLLLVGFGICTVICIVITISLKLQETFPHIRYFTSALDDVFLLGHAFGPNPVPPLLIAELFLQSSRSSAFVIAGVLQWFFHFLTGVTFLHVQVLLGAFIFLPFFPICVATFYYIFRFVPETKNKTFLDIRKLMTVQAIIRSKAKIHAEQ